MSGLDARAYHVEQAAEHAAVCTVLRWATRARAGHLAAVEVTAMLGLDLRGALTRAGGEPEPVLTGPPARLEEQEGLGRVAARARRWLYDYLAERGGSAPAGEIAAAAKTAGIGSIATLRIVRATIGASTCRCGNRWTWELPREHFYVRPQ